MTGAGLRILVVGAGIGGPGAALSGNATRALHAHMLGS
jgi:hypothetical protein